MRNLTKTLAVVSLLSPVSGHSLGIGDIKLHSALNQNLNAEISLVVSAGEKASDIKVNLAPPDKFDEAGVPWASFLSKIKFSTIVGANGSVIIKLSSREAVKEPFLDFLLEVSWPKGSLYREFTVLLDPPAVYKQATLPVITSSESYKNDQIVIPQRPSNQRPKVRSDHSLSGAIEYGPTRKKDTLWKVAEKASKQNGVSVEQMMIAMYEENPHAFYKENVHALLAGKTLKIPEREAVLKFSRKQALAEYNRQTKAWKTRLAPVPIETVSAKINKPDNQLTLIAPTKADVAENVLIAPENEQVTAKKKANDGLTTIPKTIDKEVVSVAHLVNDGLQNKITELEKQLAMMQQILALKDQQLAALQNQTQSIPAVQAGSVKTKTGQTEVVNPEIQPKPAQPLVNQPIIQSESSAKSSSKTYYLWVSGVGAGTLSILGWLWWRKRKLEEATNIHSLFASSNTSKTPEYKSYFSTPTEKESTTNVDAVSASSLFSEYTFRDFNTFDTDQGEIDPVSEADVYLAYGRYQQAEELMRDVIKDQPGRDEYKLKLLEIFYSNENKQAFEAYAHELAAAGKKDDVDFWTRVTEMGSEICQESTLFSTGLDDFSSKNNSIFIKNIANRLESNIIKMENESNNNETDFSPSSFKESFNNEVAKEIPQKRDGILDNDLTTYEAEVGDEQQNNESINYDLTTMATDVSAELNKTDNNVAPNNTQEIKGNNKFDSFEFDLGSNDSDKKDNDESNLPLLDVTDDHNYQHTDFLTDKSNGLNYSFDNDFFSEDFDHDFDRPFAGLNGQNFDQQDKFDVFDLTDMDQLETKLDLAKAYIDMSDVDAAKDMAWEVLKNGTVEQKKIAQALLNDLE